MADFHQTYITDALWDKDICVTFLGQRLKFKVTFELNIPVSGTGNRAFRAS